MPQYNLEQAAWVREIEQRLHHENPHFALCVDDSKYLRGDTVIVPQAGNLPNTLIDNVTYPRQAVRRTDGKLQYNIHMYEKEPIMVEYESGETLSYDKMTSILDDVTPDMMEFIGSMLLFDWAPDAAFAATNLIGTTGAAMSPALAGQGGLFKAPTKEDLLKVKLRMDLAKVPRKGRVCMIPAEFENEFLKIGELVDADKTGRDDSALVEGAIARILGFDIMVRSEVLVYDSDGHTVLPGTTLDTTDRHAALFWHPRFVRKAFGTVKNGGIDVIINPRRADYGGADLVTPKVRYGGIFSRPNALGVMALVQTIHT